MQKIKIGYLPLYIKLYDDSGVDRTQVEENMLVLKQMLRTHDLELVEVPICRIRPEFEAAIETFQKAGVTAIVTQHLAYSPSLESADALSNAGVPIIVLDTTVDYDLIARAGYYDGIDPNHGIHGVQDMCSVFRRRGVPYALCAGHVRSSDVIARVAGLCRAAAVAQAYRTARVGTVGGWFVGMGDFCVTPEEYREKIGAEVFEFEPETIQEMLAQVTEEEIDAEIAWDEQHFTSEITDAEANRAATKSGLAIRKWAKAMNLDSYTVNFLTLDVCGLPKMPFVECCKALTEGMGYAGEGDVLTAGLVGALRSVYPETTFTEMFCPDWEQGVVLLSHMGEVNLKLAQWKPVLRTMNFNYNSCGDTTAVGLCYRPGKATLVNLAPTKDGFSLIATEVELLGCGLEFGAYRRSIQGWMKPHMGLEKFLETYSEFGGTHHSALVYGVNADEIIAFGKMMGFETHKI